MAPQNILLRDSSSGAEAEILVGLGFNCHRLKLVAQEIPVDVLWSAPDFASGQVRPSSSGIPILFPFPGRIPGTSFSWGDQAWQLEAGDKFGNAIHGFAFRSAWELLDHQNNYAIARFDSRSDPSLTQRWPGDFILTARYELCADTLEMHFTIDNPGKRPLPFGLGLHPYFRLPLGNSGNAANCRVALPVESEWELVDMLPSGKKNRLKSPDRWQQGIEFGELTLDNVFTDLVYEPSGGRSTIADAASQRKIHVEYDRIFRELVVYTPPHREAICIEPYTCLPGAICLEQDDVDAGLCVLPPGDQCVARMAISLE